MVTSRCPVLLLILAFLSASVDPVHAATYRCATAEGAALFTQFGCPDGSRPLDAPEEAAGLLTIIDSPELSAAEQRALKVLRTELDDERRQRERRRTQQAKVRERARKDARERCAMALARLDDLQVSRRQGYGAAEDRRWDLEESRWRAVRRADC